MAEANDNEQQGLTYSKKVWIAAGILALVVVVLLLFKTLLSLFLLVFAGILIAIFFHAFAGLLRRYLHLPHTASVVVSVLFNILLLVAFFWFVGNRLSQQITQLSDTLPATIENAKDKLNQSTIGRKVLDYLNASGSNEKTRQVVKSFFSSSFGVVSDLYIVLLLAMFFTAGPSTYKRGIVHLLPPKAKDKGDELLKKLGTILKKWLKGQIIGIVFIAVLTAIGLLIVGMPLVLTLALLAGLLNFIPNFGPIIALVPAVLIAFLQGPNTAIIIICMYTGIQIIQSAVEQPLIQKKMVNIPPALTIMGQVAMGALGGFWGVLLATPIVAVIMTIVNDLYVKPQPYHKYEMQDKKDKK
ncbi:AI-2E family transporter [Ilyomonas limi]|uniref:AI-2E family transporter n=1 Tax=Ilyomonas limi TaxID=2575867 RepID=A0A4U3LAA1_9BACT|nr:AI-2E family transporter [Ilyomonas limi]TKK71579.1 AI-2E family transporter [Ilyomonas limi]